MRLPPTPSPTPRVPETQLEWELAAAKPNARMTGRARELWAAAWRAHVADERPRGGLRLALGVPHNTACEWRQGRSLPLTGRALGLLLRLPPISDETLGLAPGELA